MSAPVITQPVSEATEVKTPAIETTPVVVEDKKPEVETPTPASKSAPESTPTPDPATPAPAPQPAPTTAPTSTKAPVQDETHPVVKAVQNVFTNKKDKPAQSKPQAAAENIQNKPQDSQPQPEDQQHPVVKAVQAVFTPRKKNAKTEDKPTPKVEPQPTPTPDATPQAEATPPKAEATPTPTSAPVPVPAPVPAPAPAPAPIVTTPVATPRGLAKVFSRKPKEKAEAVVPPEPVNVEVPEPVVPVDPLAPLKSNEKLQEAVNKVSTTSEFQNKIKELNLEEQGKKIGGGVADSCFGSKKGGGPPSSLGSILGDEMVKSMVDEHIKVDALKPIVTPLLKGIMEPIEQRIEENLQVTFFQAVFKSCSCE